MKLSEILFQKALDLSCGLWQRESRSGLTLDPWITNLQSTTFFGRRLRRRQIAVMQALVRAFPKLSRNPLGHTVCRQLGWQIPQGRNRIQQALRPLQLEPVSAAEEVALWNECVARYQPLGQRRPCGPHLRHFWRDR